MSIQVGPASSGAERIHVSQRMKALGLESNAAGVVDPKSAAHLHGGLAALEASAKDGALDADGLATLRKDVGFFGRLRGQDVPISTRKTRALKAITMELNGTANVLDHTIREIRFDERINYSRLSKANLRMGDLFDKLDAWLEDGFTLAQVEPAEVRSFAQAFGRLARVAGEYSVLLSTFRSAVISREGRDREERRELVAIRDNLRSGIDGSESLERMGGMLGASAPEVPGAPQAPKAPGAGLPPDLLRAFSRTPEAEVER